jgi:hypothetical protein
MHRSPRLKNKRSLKGISEETLEEGCQPAPGGAPDSEQPVQCAPDSLRRGAADRCPRAVAPDCPVCTRQSVTVRSNGRLLQTATVGWRGMHRTLHSACPVVHRTVRCARQQKAAAFCPTASLGVRGYKYHSNRPFSSVRAQATYQDI